VTETITSFPTVVFTFLLIVCVLWWLATFALSGLDVDVDAEGTDGIADQLGFTSMPLPLALTVLSFAAWVTSASLHTALADHADEIGAGVAIGVLGAGVAAGVAAVKISSRPLGRLFATESAPSRQHTVGSFCRIRTLEVDHRLGDAEVTSGPTRGSIIQVRAEPGRFRRGDVAHVVDYDPASNTYLIDDADELVRPD
jgi:hypothetical protein